MEVYIEYVILDNLIIDFIILYLVKMITHSHFGKWNWVLALLQGVTYAIITPLFTLNTYLMVAIKFLYSLLIVISLKKYRNFRDYLIHYLLFITFTFVLGGMCYALLNALNIPYSQSGILLNGFEVPISLIILLMFGYLYLLIKLIKHHNKSKKTLGYYYNVTLTVNKKNYYIRGYLDSGNRLYDEQNNCPVAVLSLSTFCKMFNNFPFHKLVLTNVNNEDLNNAHYIKVNSANSTNNMLVFTVEKIKIETNDYCIEKSNISMGVSTKNFGGKFECLLHSDLLGGDIYA